MTIVTRTNAKTYFETGDKPTQAQFGDLIDSSLFYEDTSDFGRSLVSASAASSVRSLLGVGTVGGIIFTTNTTASVQQNIGGGVVGRTIFEAVTTASVISNLGGGTVGKTIFEAVTTASAQQNSGGGTVGRNVFEAITTASAISQLGPINGTGDLVATTSAALVMPDIGAAKGTSLALTGGSLDIFNGAGLAPGNLAIDLGNNSTTNGIQLSSGTTSYTPLIIGRKNSNTGNLAYFVYNTSNIGSISTNGSVTAYNTSSDRRLKDNIIDSESTLDVINQIKIRDFVWKSNPALGVDKGVIADELKEVLPQLVSGEKDAMRICEDGEFIDPQQVNYPALIPYLIKAVQELSKKIEILNAE